MISIQDVTKHYNGTAALTKLTLEVKKGEFFGLLGPNGAGKSTLLNILVGYINADSGTVRIADTDVNRQPFEARRKIGFVPQEIALYGRLSAWENLIFFGSLYGIRGSVSKERAEKLLRAAGLWERRMERVDTFSGGMRRRLNIISSLMHEPAVLLCDEPTVGVDPQSRNAIFDFLQEMHRNGTTVVYTTHYM